VDFTSFTEPVLPKSIIILCILGDIMFDLKLYLMCFSWKILSRAQGHYTYHWKSCTLP
jgi:hypothetical protein